VQIVVVEPAHLEEAARIVASVTRADPKVDPGARSVTSPIDGGVETLVEVAKALSAAQIALDDLSLRQPTLDEVFMTLTGSDDDDEGSHIQGSHIKGSEEAVA
jgi:ABC-2 type transport system ATP-binding protein